MAKVLDNYVPPERRGAPRKYPWETWFDGKTRRLRQGKDFKGKLHAMENLIRKTAKDRDITISVYKEDKALVIVPRIPKDEEPT